MAQQRYDMVLTRREPQQMTLDVAAHAGMHPALVERFVECGLITPVEWQGDASSDSSAVPRLCMIGRLRDALASTWRVSR